LPAVVCDLENRDATLKLYACMHLAPKKKLSVLCRRGPDACLVAFTSPFLPASSAASLVGSSLRPAPPAPNAGIVNAWLIRANGFGPQPASSQVRAP
jgi:hypothetical protein